MKRLCPRAVLVTRSAEIDIVANGSKQTAKNCTRAIAAASDACHSSACPRAQQSALNVVVKTARQRQDQKSDSKYFPHDVPRDFVIIKANSTAIARICKEFSLSICAAKIQNNGLAILGPYLFEPSHSDIAPNRF
jgi:hypothetical protein